MLDMPATSLLCRETGHTEAYLRPRIASALFWCVLSSVPLFAWCFKHVLPYRFNATAIDSHMLIVFCSCWAFLIILNLALLSIRVLKHGALFLDSSILSCYAGGEHFVQPPLLSFSPFVMNIENICYFRGAHSPDETTLSTKISDFFSHAPVCLAIGTEMFVFGSNVMEVNRRRSHWFFLYREEQGD